MNPVLARLLEERESQVALMDGILAQVETESRDLVEAEQSNLTAIRERIAQIDAQTEPLQAFEEARSAGVQASQRHQVILPGPANSNMGYTNREYEYRSGGEFMADSWRAVNHRDEAAIDRLRSVGVTIEGGMLVRADAPHTTTTEVAGILPTPIVGEIMKNIDAARPFLSTIGVKDLGSIPGTSFNRPIVTESVKVGKQNAQKTELEDGQFKIGSIPFTKNTYGGWTNVSRQAIDWTSPGVWDALLQDFQEVYALETEEAAVTAFNTAVVQETDTKVVDPANPTVQDYLRGLYDAAALSYATAKRLPDVIFASLDKWASIGPLVDQLKASTGGDGGGSSAVNSFTGNLLNVPRIVVPSLPAGKLIVGVKSRTEAYEDRIGFLTAVQPKVLGVELAYGGYMASGTLVPGAFAAVTFDEIVE